MKKDTQNGHARSKTANDASPSTFGGFQALSNVLNLQRDTNSRYIELKKCVESLGYTLPLGVTKQQLISYVHESIKNAPRQDMIMRGSMIVKSMNKNHSKYSIDDHLRNDGLSKTEIKESWQKYYVSPQRIPSIEVDDIDNNHLSVNGKPRRKRSRSWAGLPPTTLRLDDAGMDMNVARTTRNNINGKLTERKKKLKKKKKTGQSMRDITMNGNRMKSPSDPPEFLGDGDDIKRTYSKRLTKSKHKRHNQSVPDMNEIGLSRALGDNNMIRLDLSSTDATKLEFASTPNARTDNENGTDSKFSRLFRKSFSKKKVNNRNINDSLSLYRAKQSQQQNNKSNSASPVTQFLSESESEAIVAEIALNDNVCHYFHVLSVVFLFYFVVFDNRKRDRH